MTSSTHFRRRAWLSGAMVLAATVAVVLAVTGGEARASHVSCGDTITADTTLDSDLLDCPNIGIFIGADDVTLDLNGHTIGGDGTPTAGCDPQKEFCDEGVSSLGHDRITVMHGSVRGFDDGVAIGKARHARVLGISSSDNRFAAILVGRSAQSLVRNSSGSGSTARHGGTGVFLVADHHVRILNNSFTRNGDTGIFASDSPQNLIKKNLVKRNTTGMLLEGSSATKLTRNRAIRNGELGIQAGRGVIDGGGNIARHNGDPRQCVNVTCH